MDKKETVKTEADELVKKLIDQYEIEVTEEGDSYQVIIKTDAEAPTIIGRHGETIRAIQKILEVILYRKIKEPMRLLVNVNDYREKQKERLEQLAAETAERVESSSEPVALRNLSSYERKVIHEYVTKNYPNLTSYSEGEGRDRRLMLGPKEKQAE